MMHLLWVIPLVTNLAAMWFGRLHGIALLVTLACGLIALAYLIRRPRGMSPPPAQQTREERDTRGERDVPPHPGW
jgi:hypothetical protein